MSGTSSDQYLRYISLIVAGGDGNGIDLSNMRIKFSVKDPINMTPMTLYARIYNLTDQTINSILSIAQSNPASNPSSVPLIGPGRAPIRVILQAGYINNFGKLFDGVIYQFKQGQESNVDSYLDIFAADMGLGHNWAVMNKSLAAGWSQDDVWHEAGSSLSEWGLTRVNDPPPTQPGKGSRAKVCFGPTREVLRRMGQTNNFTWNLRNSELQGLSLSAYLNGTATVINSNTGMVGFPEQTEQGITVTCLLNASLGWGMRVQINQRDINRFAYALQGSGAAGTGSNPTALVSTSADGFYKILIANHSGDTRETAWYTTLTCVLIDNTANPGTAVQGVTRGFPNA